MKIIFLDIDGVLNSYEYRRFIKKRDGFVPSADKMPFTPACLENLRKIINETEAIIVINSSWSSKKACKEKLQEVFVEFGIWEYVIDFVDFYKNNKEDVLTYLRDYPSATFIFIDDGLVDEELEEHLIRTDREFGLKEEDAIQAIALLNKDLNLKRRLK